MPVAQRNAANNTAFKRFKIRPLHYNSADSRECMTYFLTQL